MLRGVARATKAATAVQSRSFTSSHRCLARVLVSDNVQPVCADIFTKQGHTVDFKPGLSKQELLGIIPEYEALVVRSATKVTEEVVNAASRLKIIGRAGTGVDNIDVPAATKHGILVVNTPGGNTQSTAELAVSHILSLARNIPQATAALKGGKWDRKSFVGKELTGKTLGVIGVGRIGREVAKSCKAFGMNVVGYDPLLAESSSRSAGIEPVTLRELFGKADFITVHTPLTAETRYLLNAETLRLCKPGVFIVNCARGGIVDEDALLEGLKSGQVGGAALDVLEKEPPTEARRELLNHPRVVVTPHLGASTSDAQERVARNVAMQMCDILAGGDFVGVVNAPNMSVARKHGLVPHVLLAERIGSLQAQLLGTAKVRNITVNLRGKKLANPEITDAVKAAVLKGALSSLTVDTVNYVNASALAEDLGMAVAVNLSSTTDVESGLSDSISVVFEIEGMLNATRTVQGTVYGENELRINSIDGFDIDLQPANDLLLFNNRDEPGVLRQVAKILAQANINIAHFSLGRKAEGRAMGAVVLDTPCPLPVLEQLRSLKGILSNVHAVHIEENVDPAFRLGGSGTGTQVAGGDRKPSVRPRHAEFSSGPCKKRPGYDLAKLRTDVLGRSHRGKLGKSRLKRAIDETKRILNVPEDYLVGIVPASDTGAFEMAMWSMLGQRPVDVFYWESFGKGWFQDAKSHLKLDVNEYSADYGKIADLAKANKDHDILFAWNGTTSGVCVPNADWIASDRAGLTFNDATSAAFAMDIAWDKVDVTTFSWQKVLGGEGAHGVLILSPRAVERLETYVPPNRPLPKIFRMVKKSKLDRDIFEGSTINTPSMLCVEDYIDALEWADSVGGLSGLMKRAQDNYAVVEKFVEQNDWIHFLAKDPAVRSCTSVCLTLDLEKDQVKRFVQLLEDERVAYDINSYRDAPSGLRIWCGATVEREDLDALMPWLSWAYETVKK